jgi:hypothetical protein
MQTNADVSLCPPGSDAEPPSLGLHLNLDFLLALLLEHEVQLDVIWMECLI